MKKQIPPIPVLITFCFVFILSATLLLTITFCESSSESGPKKSDAPITPPVVKHQSWWVPYAGQLSGLDYDPKRKFLWAVSDQSACLNDANQMVLYPQIQVGEILRCGFIYTIPFPDANSEIAQANRFFLNFSEESIPLLKQRCNVPIGNEKEDRVQFDTTGNLLKYSIDLEGIALYPDLSHLLVSVETGWNMLLKVKIESDILTVIDCFSDFLPDNNRDNNGIEGIDISDDGWVYLVHESRLEIYRIKLEDLEDPIRRKSALEVYPIGTDQQMIESFCGITIKDDQIYILDRNLNNVIRIPRKQLVYQYKPTIFYRPLITNGNGNYFKAPNQQYFFTPSLEGIAHTPDHMFWFSVDPWYDTPRKYLPISANQPYRLIDPTLATEGIAGGAAQGNNFLQFVPMLIQARFSEE